jgi:hypothetical protein
MNPPAPRRPWLGAALAAALLIAALVRVAEALRSPLWFDEAYVLLVARQAPADIVRTIASDIHPPLAFLLRGAWTALGGQGVLWHKALSILCALGSLAMVARLGRRMFDARVALVAVAFAAVTLGHVRYSQEIEFFSLGWLLFTLQLDAAWSWLESRRGRHGALLALWTMLACLTHYAMLASSAVLALWGAVALRREPRALGRWLAGGVVVALAFAPQAVVFASQFAREGSGAYFRWPSVASVFGVLRQQSLGWPAVVPVFVALALVPLLRSGPWRRPATLLWALCTLPLLATRAWVIILPREATFMIGPWLLLVAAGLVLLPVRGLRWVACALLIAVAGWRLARHHVFPEAVETGRAIEFLRPRVVAGDYVVHAETHSLLAGLTALPHLRHRILVPEGQRVPYFDGGLEVPDSCYLSPAGWTRVSSGLGRWWGLRVDRAFATRGTVSRAGAAGELEIEAARPESTWRFGPITLWRGGRAPADSAISAAP